MHDRFRILFICTGNICRSPMAQALLGARLRSRLQEQGDRFQLTSAGTHGLDGWGMERDAVRALTDLGVAPTAFSARALLADHVEGADLVLGAAREHRAAAISLVPKASTKTFTLREFARLASRAEPTAADASSLGDDVVDKARKLVERAARQRGHIRPRNQADDDIADPYGRGIESFRRVGAEIGTAVDVIIDLLS